MYNQIITFLLQNNLFETEQNGFRPGRSVTTAAVDFVEAIINSIENGEKVMGIFMDLTKAFDSVDHVKLIQKLSAFIRGPSLSWFKSYLSNRQQFVELPFSKSSTITSHRSLLKPIKYGVPQGSILGPLLFVCYMKGLPQLLSDCPQNKIIMYADDATLKLSGKSHNTIDSLATVQLDKINKFFANHQLLLNSTKTSFMEIQTKQAKNRDQLEVWVEGDKLKEVSSVKFLGLIMIAI